MSYCFSHHNLAQTSPKTPLLSKHGSRSISLLGHSPNRFFYIITDYDVKRDGFLVEFFSQRPIVPEGWSEVLGLHI
jgi:hypothetical protein